MEGRTNHCRLWLGVSQRGAGDVGRYRDEHATLRRQGEMSAHGTRHGPPVEAILAEVLTHRGFTCWLQRTAGPERRWPESWLYRFLKPHLAERGRIYRCTVVLARTLIIDDATYATPDWVASWCDRWAGQELTAAEAANTLVCGTTA